VVLTEENVIASLDLRSGDICEFSWSYIQKSKLQVHGCCVQIFCACFFNTFLNICGFYVMQFGDISLTRMTLWISLVYHLENVSLIFVSLWRLSLEKISLFITVSLFHSIRFLALLMGFLVSSTHG